METELTPEEEKKRAKAIYDKEYQDKNKDKRKLYLLKNKEKIAIQKKERFEANKEKYTANVKKWRENNKEQTRAYQKNKRKTDPLYRLKSNLKTTILMALKKSNYPKRSHTEQILGCSYQFLKEYLESKFESWMNWENKGNWNGYPTCINTHWDIDHIIPLSSAKDEFELLKLCHYTNLQPLCSYHNRYIKRNNVTD